MPTSQSISHVKRMPRQNLSKPKNVDKKNNNFKWFKTMHAVDHNHPVTKKPTCWSNVSTARWHSILISFYVHIETSKYSGFDIVRLQHILVSI